MAPRRLGLLRALAGTAAAVLLVAGCGGSDGGGDTGSGTSARGSATSATPSPSDGATTTAPAPPDPRAGMPRAGQCFQMSARQTRSPVATGRQVRCRSPHTTVVAYAGLVRGAITAQTPVERRRAIARRTCAPALARTAGGTPADRVTSLLTWVFFSPSAEQLERGARWVRCDVVARSGDVLVPLTGTAPPLLSGGVPEALRTCQTATGVDVSCSRQHAYRVAAVYREARPAYPAAPAYTAVARDRCRALLTSYGGYWQPPSRAGWAAGDRFVRCLRQDPPPATTAPPG